MCLSFNAFHIDGLLSKNALNIPSTKRFPAVKALPEVQPIKFIILQEINSHVVADMARIHFDTVAARRKSDVSNLRLPHYFEGIDNFS